MEVAERHGGTNEVRPTTLPLRFACRAASALSPLLGAGRRGQGRLLGSNSSSESSTWLTAWAIETSPVGMSDPGGQRWKMRPSVVDTSSAIFAASSAGMSRTCTRPLAISVA